MNKSIILNRSYNQHGYIADVNQNGLDLNSNFTVEVSFLLDVLPSQIGTPFALDAKNSLSDNQRAYQLYIGTDNRIYCDFYQHGDAATWTRFSTTDPLPADAIYQFLDISVQVNISIPLMAFKINGQAVSSVMVNNTSAGLIFNSSAPYCLGARRNGGTIEFPFAGKIADLRRWNTYRTDQELADNRRKELVGNESGLVLYIKGTNLNDSSIKANNLIGYSANPVIQHSVIVPWSKPLNGWEEVIVDKRARSWAFVKASDTGQYVLAVNAWGRVFVSTNYGTTFTERRPSGDVNRDYYGCYMSANGALMVVVQVSGRIYTSTDYGVSWTERQPAGNVDRAWYKVSCDDDGSFIIAGVNGGRLYTSANGGVSWTERQPAGNVDRPWYPVACCQDGSIAYAAAIGGRVYKTTDSGVTWTEIRPKGNLDGYWKALECSKNGQYIVIGEYGNGTGGRLYRSTDYGATFTEIQPGGNVNRYWARASMTRNGQTVLVTDYGPGIDGGRVYYSENYGATWVELRPNGDINRTWCAAAIAGDGSKMYAGYFWGSLYSYTFSTAVIPSTELIIKVDGVPLDIASLSGTIEITTN